MTFDRNICYPNLGFTGRLGNALFELAATAGIADRLGVEPRFNANWIHRPYFSVPDRFFTDDLTGCVRAWSMPAADHIDARARQYLQDVNLFIHMMPTIREWLTPSPLAQEILADQAVEFEQLQGPVGGVHVRRGDNIKDPGVPNKADYHRTPPIEFYLGGIQLLSAHGAASIAAFTDDPEWCREHLPVDYVHEGVPRPKEHEADYLTAPVLDWVDLQLLTRCDAHIVSGSTFGVWGALLGRGRVWHATEVYGPRLDYIDSDLLFPSDWSTLGVW